MTRSISTRLTFVIAILIAAQITACGGDDERAKKGAKWLKSYSQTNPPNGDWVTTNVEVDRDGRVVMDVLVPYKRQIDQIRARTKIEQSHIVRLACPSKDAEIWTILNQDDVLWVNLTARGESGLAEVIIAASCKH